MTRIYAGIGSRRTPFDVCQIMIGLGHKLAGDGWILRSGGAEGADDSFEKGADLSQGQKEIILPWPGFNGNPGNLVIGEREGDQWAYETAQENFPWFEKQQDSVKKLLARNMMQVLGIRGDEPCAAVICWTDAPKGGTNYAMTLAERNNIPVWNLHDDLVMGKAHRYLSDHQEGDPWPEAARAD